MVSIRQQIKTFHEKGFISWWYLPSENINEPDAKYLNNVNFNELFSMFKFDKSLRELFLNYYLIAENQFKTHVAFDFSHKYKNKGIEAYINYNNYDCGLKKIIMVLLI